MNSSQHSVLQDQELVDMLIDEPELLAVADALVATKRRDVVRASRPLLAGRRHRARTVSVAAALAALAAGIALLLVSPWRGSPSLVQQALAAVGNDPVLHVVVTQPARYGPLVELRTGKTIAQTERTEAWFDGERSLKKTVRMLDGQVLDEELDTEQGGWNQGGPVITCAWIAAHPVEATRLRVSCNPSGENGTTPRTIPETPPTLEPALAGFVDRYRSALVSGVAKEVQRGRYDGHDVVWLEFSTIAGTERVAVDADSYEPLAIEEEGGELTLRVVEAETVPYSATLFTKPKATVVQTGSTMTAENDVTPEAAAAILGGHALWLGRSWNGLQLVQTTHQEERIGYGPDQEPQHADVIRFTYAPLAADGTSDLHSRIEIYEATTCIVRVGWECTPRDPSAEGTIRLSGWITRLRSDGLYVSVWNVAHPQEWLDLARALTPLVG